MLRPIESLPYDIFVGAIAAMRSPRRQRLGDTAARTLVGVLTGLPRTLRSPQLQSGLRSAAHSLSSVGDPRRIPKIMQSYNRPMEITPDTKDWTWVLTRPCPECGLDTRRLQLEEIPQILRSNAAQWLTMLAQSDEVRDRPASNVWSPLEYACHVRDVFRLYDERLQRMLAEDAPLYPNWDQDAEAVSGRYGEQDPATVAVELQDAAATLASHFEQVAGVQWERTGTRSDGAQFTVATFARYFIHDPVHHLYDVTGRRQNGSEKQS